jgi:hypothetical protein
VAGCGRNSAPYSQSEYLPYGNPTETLREPYGTAGFQAPNGTASIPMFMGVNLTVHIYIYRERERERDAYIIIQAYRKSPSYRQEALGGPDCVWAWQDGLYPWPGSCRACLWMHPGPIRIYWAWVMGAVGLWLIRPALPPFGSYTKQ